MVTEYLLGLGGIQLGGLGLRPDFSLSAQPVIACPALGTPFLLIKTICKGCDLRFLVNIRLFSRTGWIFFSHRSLGRLKATAIDGAGQGTSYARMFPADA
jgi:hypothetical protein